VASKGIASFFEIGRGELYEVFGYFLFTFEKFKVRIMLDKFACKILSLGWLRNQSVSNLGRLADHSTQRLPTDIVIIVLVVAQSNLAQAGVSILTYPIASRHPINFSEFLINELHKMFFIILQPDKIAQLLLKLQFLCLFKEGHQLILFVLLDWPFKFILDHVLLVVQLLDLLSKQKVLVRQWFVKGTVVLELLLETLIVGFIFSPQMRSSLFIRMKVVLWVFEAVRHVSLLVHV